MTAGLRKGFALVNAIFLIMVLSMLALGLAAISVSTQTESTQSLLSAKVYYGAKAGLEWGIQQAVTANNTTLCPTNGSTGTVGPTTLTQGGLDGIIVTVTCEREDQGSTATGNQVFLIISTATSTTSTTNVNYAQREIRAIVSNIP